METQRQKRLEAQKKRIVADAKRRLDALDELHKSLDPRGWNSQRGQALLDLLFNNCTQAMADVASLQCEVLDLQEALLSANEQSASAQATRMKHQERARAALALREARQDITQTECAAIFGCSASGYGVLLGEARAMRGKDATARD